MSMKGRTAQINWSSPVTKRKKNFSKKMECDIEVVNSNKTV